MSENDILYTEHCNYGYFKIDPKKRNTSFNSYFIANGISILMIHRKYMEGILFCVKQGVGVKNYLHIIQIYSYTIFVENYISTICSYDELSVNRV